MEIEDILTYVFHSLKVTYCNCLALSCKHPDDSTIITFASILFLTTPIISYLNSKYIVNVHSKQQVVRLPL